jgi:hypothetical protein
MLLPFRGLMVMTIEFQRQLQLRAIEIGYKRPDGMLSSEL